MILPRARKRKKKRQKKDFSNIPTSSFIGALLIQADRHHQKLKKSKELKKKSIKGYHHRYPRTITTYLKLSKAIEIMRYTYKFSMNNIGLGLKISTRTVKNYIDRAKKTGQLGINLVRRGYSTRSKNMHFKSRLLHISARVQSYLDGHLDLLTLYLKLGLEPP